MPHNSFWPNVKENKSNSISPLIKIICSSLIQIIKKKKKKKKKKKRRLPPKRCSKNRVREGGAVMVWPGWGFRGEVMW